MGGNAIKNAGVIHKDEVLPTINKLSKELNLDNLSNNLIGSTGKKEYSGDIDIALEFIDNNYISNFFNTLKELYGQDNVRKFGSMICLLYPISNYDSTKCDRLPRTGKVQIDFNFGNIEWLKLFNYCDGNLSKFKSVHRNLCIAAILSSIPESESNQKDEYGRSVDVIKYKWSPSGLIKTHRVSVYNSDGKCSKKQKDTPIGEPITSIELISPLIFKNSDATINDINSVETILVAIKKFFNIDYQEKIFKCIAQNFQNSVVDYKKYPMLPEIEKYFIESL